VDIFIHITLAQLNRTTICKWGDPIGHLRVHNYCIALLRYRHMLKWVVAILIVHNCAKALLRYVGMLQY